MGSPVVREQSYERVRILRDEGFLQREIAEITGLSRSYVGDLLIDPKGANGRARKESYGGVCEICGGPTTGSNGPKKAPSRCVHCQDQYWTEGVVVAAIQEWARRRGKPPTANEWTRQLTDPDGYRFPAKTSVYNSTDENRNCPFEQWSDAIETAGFTRPLRGVYDRSKIMASNTGEGVHVMSLTPAPRGYPIKIVRDFTADIINPSGVPGELWYAATEDPATKERLLRLKLAEEVGEFLVDGGEKELSDVMAVIRGLEALYQVDLDGMYRNDHRGGFLKGVIMYGRHEEFDK